ncbi:MAG TPA: hypothetical protein VL284_00265 [Thermoanaerobaculia bacterium]|nr:hypothetical protein [Thermoanaerobaculia bacterium]
MRRALAVAALLALAACRTTRPPNAPPLAPLTSTTASDAARQLALRRSEFQGERSMIRVRLPQISARGQLQVDSSGRMLMTVYSPLGTTLARLFVDRDEVIFLDDFHSTAWRGRPSDLNGNLAMFGNSALPLLLVGLPVPGVSDIAYAPSGIQNVRVADVDVTYDPPVYPPKVVAIDRGAQHMEIEHLDSYADSTAVQAPRVPGDYRCCVLPQM